MNLPVIGLAALVGVVGGPFALRAIIGVAPGGLKTRLAKWQLHRGLAQGDGWLVHQDGEQSYRLEHINPEGGHAEVGDERLEYDNLGHLSTKTASVPLGASYGPGAVADSDLVGMADSQCVDVAPPADIDSVDVTPPTDTDTEGAE